jgi:hypothetical protein
MRNTRGFWDYIGDTNIVYLIIIVLFICLLLFLCVSYFFSNMSQVKFNVYEKQVSNYTVLEDKENYLMINYTQSIVFTLAPIEEYSVNSIINLIPLHKLNPICDTSSNEYYEKYLSCGGVGCFYPQEWISDDLKRNGCFNLDTYQSIINVQVINNSNIRQIGDTLKNLDTKRQDIKILVTITNSTKYITKVNVTKINETIVLIISNVNADVFIFKLNKDWLNTNATCINSVCPKGYEDGYSGGKCYKCGFICNNFYSVQPKIKDKICNKWQFDKYIIEEVN